MQWRLTVGAVALSASLAALACGPVAIARTPQPRASLAAAVPRPAIDRLIEQYKAKGLTDAVVLVARDGEPIFRSAFGLANREWHVPNAPDGEFWIGSMTKQFTAVAILKLAQDGKLSLDDRISKYVQGAPASWREITIRNLLTHTSGIPNHTSLPEWVEQTWVGRSPEELIRFLHGRPLDFEPGAKFQYDNAGYVILGLIVERASGQALSDYLASNVFAPLGMKHTGFVGDQVVLRRASGYERNNGRWRAAPWVSAIRDSGAGGMYSNADDLLTWDKALYDPNSLGLKDLMPLFTDYGHGFGYGYVVSSQEGRPRWWHNGHVAGFSSIMARYPQDRLTVIVLSNDDGAPVEDFSKALGSILLGPPSGSPR